MLFLDGITDELIEGEYIMSDKKYLHCKILTENDYSIESRMKFRSKRQIIEHVNARIKKFMCLKGTFRGSRNQNYLMFKISCNVSNIELLLKK
jgi:hypothetical protein